MHCGNIVSLNKKNLRPSQFGHLFYYCKKCVKEALEQKKRVEFQNFVSKITNKLCNGDCIRCEIMRSKNRPKIYVIFGVLHELFEGAYQIINDICANMTTCPLCCSDDFSHEEGCQYITIIDRIAEEYQKVAK